MKKNWLALSGFCLFLLSCTRMPGGTPYPNYGQGPGQEPNNNQMVQTTLQLGNTQRNFSPEENLACLLDPKLQELVVTFKNNESGSKLSLRLNGINSGRNQKYLSSQNGSENVFIALGGIPDANTYQLEKNSSSSNCYVTLDVNQNYVQGLFQCQKLKNRRGIEERASGTFSCGLQSSQDWNW